MLIFRACLTAMIVASSGISFAQIVDNIGFKMAVNKSHGRTTFKFYREELINRVPTTSKVRIAILIVTVKDNAIRWRIDANDQFTGLEKFTYGVVPVGFTQVIPKTGSAPDLIPGEEYSVAGTGEGIGLNSFVY